MPETWERESDALADNNLTTSARTLLGWIRTRDWESQGTRIVSHSFSVTIWDVAEAMTQSRNTASRHLNELENAGHIERFLPGGAKSEHSWRLT